MNITGVYIVLYATLNIVFSLLSSLKREAQLMLTNPRDAFKVSHSLKSVVIYVGEPQKVGCAGTPLLG